MPRSPWVTRALSAALPSKSHDPFVQVGHEEASPELPVDPYLASLVDEAAYAPAPSGHSCEDDGLCELVHPSPESFQPADWLPEKWATRPSQED